MKREARWIWSLVGATGTLVSGPASDDASSGQDRLTVALKQPWEIFVDALREQLARHDVDVGPSGVLRKVPEADVPRMSTAIANAVLDHLTSVEGLDREEALEVTKLFFEELGRPSSEPLRRRLRRVWEEWAETG